MHQAVAGTLPATIECARSYPMYSVYRSVVINFTQTCAHSYLIMNDPTSNNLHWCNFRHRSTATIAHMFEGHLSFSDCAHLICQKSANTSYALTPTTTFENILMPNINSIHVLCLWVKHSFNNLMEKYSGRVMKETDITLYIS